MADNAFTYWILGDHVFMHDALGWRHGKLPPHEANKPLDYETDITWAGPFATAAEAARDAAPHLDPVLALFTRDQQVPDAAMRELAAALTDELSAQPRKR